MDQTVLREGEAERETEHGIITDKASMIVSAHSGTGNWQTEKQKAHLLGRERLSLL